MVRTSFEVDELAIAYIMQLRGIKDFAVDRNTWKELLRGVCGRSEITVVEAIRSRLKKESNEARHLKEFIEKKWRLHEQNVLKWLKEISQVDFKAPVIRVCVVLWRLSNTIQRHSVGYSWQNP